MTQFPPEATRALVYRDNIDALEWLKTNRPVDWVLDKNPGIR
ncbi:unnamed protein product [Ectocarpus sp. 6 AP-2014]